MTGIDLTSQAAVLRDLLAADAVLYWRRENASLALPLGAAPPDLMSAGFLPPACTGSVCLRRGQAAGAMVPLRMRSHLHGESGMVLAGNAGERGGILVVWHSRGPESIGQAEGVMALALAALASLLDLANAHGEIQRSEVRRLNGMADALPQGVIVVPAGNRPGYVNDMAGALLGLPRGPVDAGQLAGSLAGLARRAKDHDVVDAQVEAFIAGHGSKPLSGRVWHFDGSPSALRVTVAPIDPERAAGWLWLLEDVSLAEAEAEARERQRHLEWLNAELAQRVRERTVQLEQTNEVLLQANMELEHFARAMAHDLQTPLRSIAGFAQLVQGAVRQYGDAEIDAWASQVVNNTKRLQTLIQGLLSYTRLDAHALRLEEADMNEVFDEVVGSLQAMIGEAAAEVGRGPLPAVSCVRLQISQVLQNLIENGIKYNTAKPPRVFVSCERRGGEWVFSVRDNGMGIDPKYHGQVFDMLKRLHGYAQIPGTGIGLALCRRIVERHGGRIWVESETDKGATFRFTLPAERPAAP